MLVIASTAIAAVNNARRWMRLVSQAVTGEPMHSTTAPKAIRSPAVRILTSRLSDNSLSIPAGARTEQPVTILPSINALGAKRVFTPSV
jgi:hypothetical protein